MAVSTGFTHLSTAFSRAMSSRGFSDPQIGEVPVVTSITAEELMRVELPELELILEPWLREKNLVMVHAKRGIGKTLFNLGLANAAATGGQFLGWKAKKAWNVLYIDGEMPAQQMKARIRELATSSGVMPEKLRIITPDLQDEPMPDLATIAGQQAVDDQINRYDIKLIFLDNLSCLVRSGGAENDAESWSMVSPWLLAHRRAGRAIVLVHHSGKGGAQRGTSKREDLLDVVIRLSRPGDYSETEGAVFEIQFEKGRDLTGDDLASLEARLVTLPNGSQEWTWRPVDSLRENKFCELWETGQMSLNDIAGEMGCNKSTAHRHLEHANDTGQLKRPYPQRKSAKKGA